MGPAGFVSAGVKVTGVAEDSAADQRNEGDPEISVDGGLLGSLLGMEFTHRSRDLNQLADGGQCGWPAGGKDKYAF